MRVLLCLLLLAPLLFAERRALLIGNSNYAHLPGVPSATKEVAALKAALQAAQFSVTAAENVTQADLLTKLEPAFLASLKPSDTALVYYSGHSVQAEGDNFLLPVEFNPASRADLRESAYTLARLEQKLRGAAGLKIIIVEAPRELPAITAKFGTRGLSTPDPAEWVETLMAFGAVPNQVDPAQGDSRVRLFTQAWVDAIQKPGLELAELGPFVTRAVIAKSEGKQKPYFSPGYSQTFYFTPPLPVKPTEPEKVTVYVEKPREAGFTAVNRKDRQEYAWIPPGTFKMGCVPADNKCEEHEKPQHQVKMTKGFWLGVNEVTVDAYKRFVDADSKRRSMPKEKPYWLKKWEGEYPVAGVTWDEAQSFCQWVGGRLPTEAEWEYAARAGQADEVLPLNSENSRDKANFYGKRGNDRFEDAAPVRKFDRNAFGLFDIFGNVWEWCLDWYSPTYYRESPAADPAGPETGTKRIARGGSFFSDANKHLRISFREAYSKPGNNVGFRCQLSDTPDTQNTLQLVK